MPRRSTEVVVGRDMHERADVIVSELVDTELIGEGCLSTYRHALQVFILVLLSSLNIISVSDVVDVIEIFNAKVLIHN